MAIPGHINLNDLLVFSAVADMGGFTAAAERLNVAPAKVSLEIARLEAQLGVALFSRTTRKVALTEAGESLHQQSKPLLEQLQAAVDGLHVSPDQLTGTLRVTAPVDHAVQMLAPALARFAVLHPKLQIDLRTSDRISDLVAEGIDVAIRMGWLRDSSQRAVKLGEFQQYLVASPDYLRRAGTPQSPLDLASHDWVALTLLRTPLTWTFSSNEGEERTVHLKARMKADSASSLRALVLHGAGLTVLDQFSSAPELAAGRLVRLLPDWQAATGGLYAVFPPGRHVAPKARAFVRFYQEFLAQQQSA
ncbi:HTH-type transcriptional regulator PtxR [Massilia terrae]|uniref:LysR family transcriptional regulator n=1 Tax=Massilia terrae TaxID=1811224 RepID=A0ABT2CTZ5_9BURK|nr:LysR family transcriptional regulator [Massilia terrae]MCS0657446.1 LysR family transcriptional regulator [Massilia terrae]